MPHNEDVYVGLTLNFGHRVKCRRENIGLTQNDLAKLVGVSKTTIQNYEAGNIPKGLFLFKLSRFLKCSIDYLLLGEESPYIQKEWIPENPFGMDQEELAEYHNQIKGTWLEQYVFEGKYTYEEGKKKESLYEENSESVQQYEQPVDLVLIGRIIEIVEELLQEEGTNLPPAKKRRLVELLYKYFKGIGKDADKETSREYIRLVA